jgi:hypothetical protein
MVPLVAVALGVLTTDEPLTWNLLLGATMLLAVAILEGRLTSAATVHLKRRCCWTGATPDGWPGYRLATLGWSVCRRSGHRTARSYTAMVAMTQLPYPMNRPPNVGVDLYCGVRTLPYASS